MTPYEGATVWFLTGSQTMYGEETLAQVAEQSKAVCGRLGQDPAMPVDVRWQPVMVESDGILETIRQANADPHCVGLIAWMHTFSPAKMWLRGLEALDVPMLHLHTQANRSLPWDTIDMDFMNLNQSAHGDREFGHALTRVGVPRVTVVGHVEDDEVRERIARWARVAVAVGELGRMKVVRFGDNMRQVAVTDGDKVEAERHFGVAVNTWGVNDLVEAVEDVADGRVDALASEYEERYDVAPELRTGGDRHESLRYAARQEAGLRDVLTERDATAFTTNFEDLGGLRQLPGLAVQRLMEDGYGFGGEGDWKVAAMTRTLKVIGQGLPGGTSFMEDYTYHFGPGEPLVLGAHMLEVCPTIAAHRPTVEIHPLGIGAREDPVRMRFVAAPAAAAVNLSLVDLGDRFRFVANVVDVVEPAHELPRLPVACAVWKPRPSLSVSAELWLRAGGSHHTVLSTAVDAEDLRTLAALSRTELTLIDERSTRP